MIDNIPPIVAECLYFHECGHDDAMSSHRDAIGARYATLLSKTASPAIVERADSDSIRPPAFHSVNEKTVP